MLIVSVLLELTTSFILQYKNVNISSVKSSAASDSDAQELSNVVTLRFPTSPEDQIRQAAQSLRVATKDNKTRHSIRLLLPIIGATELDDWPGGARQMMEAASPLMKDVMRSCTISGNDVDINEGIIDEADGVRALFGQAEDPMEDSCVVLLPSAENFSVLKDLDEQVGSKRNLVLVNAQWRRKTDFGLSLFGKRDDKIKYVESFEPTFHCSNVIVEGNICRLLRTYPGPWRVYLRTVEPQDEAVVDWIEIGTKNVLADKTGEWENKFKGQDGGAIFDYGIPSYGEILDMIVSREGYEPKSLSDRAASAFTFIKDTL